MPSRTKTDNTPAAFAGKVGLRLAAVEAIASRDPRFMNRELRVLDCYAGAGRLWSAVRRCYDGKLEVMGVDTRRFRRSIKVDNRRILRSLDLDTFDLIDLDAYGVPAEQAQIIAERGYRGPIVWTCIAMVYGLLPAPVTDAEGIPREWRRICPSLFGEHDAAGLAARWCTFLDRLGWENHAWLTTADKAAKLYGISTTGLQGVTRAALNSAILSVNEKHEDPMGQQLVEPDDGLHEDH
jgi:hypothetical protein